jgi:hypothetical protein
MKGSPFQCFAPTLYPSPESRAKKSMFLGDFHLPVHVDKPLEKSGQKPGDKKAMG